MFSQDRFFIGVVTSILISCLAFFVITLLNEELAGTFIGSFYFRGIRDQFVVVLAVVSNVIPFRIYNNKRYVNSMRGVGLVTLLEGIAVVIYMFA